MVLMPLTLLVMGVPIFLLLLATCITTVVFFTTLPHVIVHQVVFDSLNKFPLIAVPFFIFTGDLMSSGGISARLLRWVASMIGGFAPACRSPRSGSPPSSAPSPAPPPRRWRPSAR